MSKIDNIISETIHSYISSNVLMEDSKKNQRFRKKAIKSKGGLRKDFDVEDDKQYNKNVDAQEETSIKNILTNGFVNIKKVAEKLYPHHTPEGAQSELNKKLTGAKSDSGSPYKLKSKEVKKLRQIIATDILK
jgi:hypothetical protein